MTQEIHAEPDPLRSAMPYPLVFEPVYMSRVWGSRTLAQRFGRELPEGPIGEAWDLVDRAEAVSRVSLGPLGGMDLHTLWNRLPRWFFSQPVSNRPDRFPLLLKLLDCRERLSVQVHPDAASARLLGGEAKSELWVMLETAPNAEIFAGLVAGVTREQFEEALSHGGEAVVPLLQRLTPHPGEVLFMPAGCLHAIGAGVLLCEIQENSDTTFRVYDWNRTGLDGRPRPLHRRESLQCLTFGNPPPQLVSAQATELMMEGPFRVRRHFLNQPGILGEPDRFAVGVVLEGQVRIGGGSPVLTEGTTFLLPAPIARQPVVPVGASATVLSVLWNP